MAPGNGAYVKAAGLQRYVLKTLGINHLFGLYFNACLHTRLQRIPQHQGQVWLAIYVYSFSPIPVPCLLPLTPDSGLSYHG